MHRSQWSLFEGHRYELLRIHIVKPVREWPVRTPKHLLVLIYSLLIAFIVVGRGQSRHMSEIRERMLTPALACIDGGHRTSFVNTRCLVSLRYDVIRNLLEIKETLLVADRLDVMSIRGLIGPISLLLDLRKQPRCGTVSCKHSCRLITFSSNCPIIRSLAIGVELASYLEKVLFYISLHKLSRCRTLNILCHRGIIVV